MDQTCLACSAWTSWHISTSCCLWQCPQLLKLSFTNLLPKVDKFLYTYYLVLWGSNLQMAVYWWLGELWSVYSCSYLYLFFSNSSLGYPNDFHLAFLAHLSLFLICDYINFIFLVFLRLLALPKILLRYHRTPLFTWLKFQHTGPERFGTHCKAYHAKECMGWYSLELFWPPNLLSFYSSIFWVHTKISVLILVLAPSYSLCAEQLLFLFDMCFAMSSVLHINSNISLL